MAFLLARSILTCFLVAIVASAANFEKDFQITWGGHHVKLQRNGTYLDLVLDKTAGSAFQSNNEYLYGRFDMQIKLVPNDSAGTVATFYMSSVGPLHDEIDFEFLGNSSGEPYTIHTNLYSLGKGDKEMQFKPWFDPTKSFHTYTVVWNPMNIVWLIDDLPIRVFKNLSAMGIPYPSTQPMKIFASIWDADQWATRGGLVKTNWTHAPFVASFRNPKGSACISNSLYVLTKCSYFDSTWWNMTMDSTYLPALQFMQSNYMIYNYCTDSRRFPQGFPPECSAS